MTDNASNFLFGIIPPLLGLVVLKEAVKLISDETKPARRNKSNQPLDRISNNITKNFSSFKGRRGGLI